MTCYFCGSFIISHFSFKIICLVLLYVPLCSSVCIGRKFLCVVSMALSHLNEFLSKGSICLLSCSLYSIEYIYAV